MSETDIPSDEHSDHLTIALRAYAEPPPVKPTGTASVVKPSPWVLVLDTETGTDAGQPLRFAPYQVREEGELFEQGLVYRPEVLAASEVVLLTAYAEKHGLRLRTQADFIASVFYGIGYELRATIVGFNLPFDLSRLAIRHGPARKSMRGGFSFTLSADKRLPAVRVKHLSRRMSFIKFAAPFRQRTGRSDRKRGRTVRARPGLFLDVNTLAHALLSRSFSLATLADHLRTETRKAATDEHGSMLTPAYIAYAVQDTQVTWECYAALKKRYAELQLLAPMHGIYSEASLGKAYLAGMGVRPWREVQPDAPPEITGTIMSTYYGGRSEVRIRREVRQVVLCDFLSMYPTVCTLMGLWRFVIASGMTWHDDTDAVRTMLQGVTLDELQQPDTWRGLTVLVQVEAAADVFPVRAAYDATATTTIGLNHLKCGRPLWFTLADCIASKLLTGRAPRVLRAVRYAPKAPQAGLQTVAINGNADFRVRPDGDDFYRRLIELRQDVKRSRDAADGDEREHLDALQNALKIAANATSYGIFAEVNVDEPGERRTVRVHTGSETPYEVATRKVEEPGRYFHPLVATLITGAARLMLALAERQVTDAGLVWAFCDTDSMAIAKPVDLEETAFHARVDTVVGWFASLNPYGFGGTVLKVEDVNTDLTDNTRRAPLFCYAVSAKRYVLFNVDADEIPVLRKASAHGLGHLLPAYDARNPTPGIPEPSVSLEKLGVALWQHDLWWLIARAALHGPVVRLPLDHHEAMQQPALSRYAATTPDIHRWFGRYNEGRPYDAQVRPFGFLNAFTSRDGMIRPVAPFDRDPARSAFAAFDRNSGKTVQASALATYATVLAQYHLHAEPKFRNGRSLDAATTLRRHVVVLGTTYIGKEANRWEEQFFIGLDPQATVDYGSAPNGWAHLMDELLRARSQTGERVLADAIGISRETLRRLLTQRSMWLDGRTHDKIGRSLPALLTRLRREEEECSRVFAELTSEIDRDGLTPVARRIGCDPTNLAAIRSGRRAIPKGLLSRIRGATSISSGLPARDSQDRK